ncbi:protein of unknown function UPF0153 [Desulfotomaculum nigrificans CO-1-SRB]|uniref:Fe-S oxidoreductase n=1 Tax=Desulfotomaculum nigrificans (strain DSM 14880 / VKM B-2319 / CO-1-SRB) TaxID=868595 RepID=F6B5U7_DESCC|nr:YkgJ family cysteine cluster protein [Desulfotomaculum nigrificans]AEF93170.1 protein of unknown function UPF0153 [Desulfotomaculum nigrificans CO-1-SRB]
MLAPDKLKEKFKKVSKENWLFRTFLKGQEPDELDRLVNEMHKELFSKMDCVACSNCCKTIVPVLKNDDILRIANHLELSADEFKKNYLKEMDGKWVIGARPCPFLKKQGCEIYDYRPENCKEYPYTHKNEIVFRLINLVENCEVCPIVFEIFERLKKIYKDEFKEYKRQMVASNIIRPWKS